MYRDHLVFLRAQSLVTFAMRRLAPRLVSERLAIFGSTFVPMFNISVSVVVLSRSI
jgi:hypothetical protein